MSEARLRGLHAERLLDYRYTQPYVNFVNRWQLRHRSNRHETSAAIGSVQ